MWNFSGGSLVGPTGTGKTETVKVLFSLFWNLHLFISYISYQQVLSWGMTLSRVTKSRASIIMFNNVFNVNGKVFNVRQIDRNSEVSFILAYITRKKKNRLSENKTVRQLTLKRSKF